MNTSATEEPRLGPIATKLKEIAAAKSQADHFAFALESAVKRGPRGADTIYLAARNYVGACEEVRARERELAALDEKIETWAREAAEKPGDEPAAAE